MSLSPELLSKLKKEYEDILSEDQKSIISALSQNLRERLKDENKPKVIDSGVVDKLYAELTEDQKLYVDAVNNAKFDFFLNEDEYKLIHTKLITKGKFAVQDNSIWLMEKLNQQQIPDFMKTKVGKDSVVNYKLTCAQSVTLYTLLSPVYVEGLGREYNALLSILKKLGGISVAYSPYHQDSEDLGTSIQDYFDFLSTSEEELNEPIVTESEEVSQ